MKRILIRPSQEATSKKEKLKPGEQQEKYGKTKRVIHEDLPQLPFNVLIVGPRHSGKTVLLETLLSKEDGMYGHFFRPENII